MNDDLIGYGAEAAKLPDGVIGTPAAKMAEAKKTTNVKSKPMKKELAYYSFPGGSKEEICQYFKDRNGEVGLHDTVVRYKILHVTDDQVDEVVFWGESKITMPKWSALSKQPKEVRADWKNMYKILNRHELKHRYFFKQTFDKEIQRIRKMAHEKGRKLSEQEIEGEKEKAREECQSASDQYDTDSKHGADEGLELRMCL